jgi:hypothetical protein
MTFAGNGATGLVTGLFSKLVCWWVVLALLTTILGCLDLNPLPGPENVVVGAALVAVCAAFSPFFPGALSIFWAWVTAAGHSLALVNLTALHTTKLGLLGDNPMPGLGAFWMVLSRSVLALLRA